MLIYIFFSTLIFFLKIFFSPPGVEGGVHATDVTNASRTMLLNLRTLKWDETVVKFFDIPAQVLVPYIIFLQYDISNIYFFDISKYFFFKIFFHSFLRHPCPGMGATKVSIWNLNKGLNIILLFVFYYAQVLYI